MAIQQSKVRICELFFHKLYYDNLTRSCTLCIIANMTAEPFRCTVTVLSLRPLTKLLHLTSWERDRAANSGKAVVFRLTSILQQLITKSRGFISCGIWRSSTCQSQRWSTSTPPALSKSSPPPLPSGTLLPLPRAKAGLQHIICSARKVIGCKLTSFQGLYQAGKTTADPSHPRRKLFKIAAFTTVSSQLQLASSTLPRTPTDIDSHPASWELQVTFS